MNKDQVKGRLKQAKGKLNEVIGNATGDDSTKLKGEIQKVIGKTQAAYGDAKEQLKKRP